MKQTLRLILVVLVVLTMTQAPDALAQGYGGCYNSCRGYLNLETGEMYGWHCVETNGMQYGYTECEWVEWDTGRYLCDIWGDLCCLDPLG